MCELSKETETSKGPVAENSNANAVALVEIILFMILQCTPTCINP